MNHPNDESAYDKYKFCCNEAMMITEGWQDTGVRCVNLLVHGPCVGESQVNKTLGLDLSINESMDAV